MVDDLTQSIYSNAKTVVSISLDVLKILTKFIEKHAGDESLINKAFKALENSMKPTTTKSLLKDGKTVNVGEVADEEIAKRLKKNCRKAGIKAAFVKGIDAKGKPTMSVHFDVNDTHLINDVLKRTVNEHLYHEATYINGKVERPTLKQKIEKAKDVQEQMVKKKEKHRKRERDNNRDR